MSTVIDNRYRLVRQLGAGGMGAVFEAEHVGVGRRVAVKLLHKTLLERDPSMLGRLQREARLAGSLDSPYIASVIDTGVDAASGS
ncbi:MAG: serine/threonine protein kinase, partial [Polyangiaceae bacterium]|nr:serine/threonine protein kinase [Polyangiaceae bacterium]